MQARLWAASHGRWFINYYLCAGKIVLQAVDPLQRDRLRVASFYQITLSWRIYLNLIPIR